MSSLKDLPITAKIGLTIGVGVLGFFLYKKLKKKLAFLPPVFPLPTNGGGMPIVSYNTQGEPTYWNPATISTELFNAMDGLFTLSGTKNDIFLKFAQLPTGDMATAVYNHYNQNFGKGETLTQWINDEYWYDYLGNGKQLALAKLQALGLP
tara:strand:+ start:289 stop:741 length:453 start_codon:yes stop_codon:yes gene_type:complete